MYLGKPFQQGLLASMIISLVACGGGGGGGKKTPPASSSPASSSVISSSIESSSLASSEAPSSSSVSSEAPSSVPASSSSEASSSVVSSVAQSSAESSSSSSIPAGVETTFNVSITPPQLDDGVSVTKTGRSARAQKPEPETLPLNQLAVVVVDLAGNVVRTIELDETNSTQNEDGSWSIRVPGYPQLDCIVIANLDGPITVFEPGDNVFDSDLLLAPTTGEDLDVSLASTAAYQSFVDELGGEGTFADLDLDVNDPAQLAVLQNLIQTVSEVLEEQVFVGAASITAALAQVQQQVSGIVEVEASNIQSRLDPAETTLVSGIEAGGVYWFESYEPSEVYYGGFAAINTPEQEQYYDGNQFQPVPEYELDGQVVLTNTGWVISNDIFQVTAFNDDGSVMFGAADAPTNSANVKATQVFSLAGRTISTFFDAYGDTRGLVPLINPTSTFAEGALGYRITIQSTNELYTLWYNAGYDYGNGIVCPWDKNGDGESNDSPASYGGNCETVNNVYWSEEGWANTSGVIETLAGLISPDVAPGSAGAKLVTIDWPTGQVIGVQLLDDTNKTAKFYLHDWTENTQTLLGETTWSHLTLPYLEGDAAAAIGFEIPESVREEGDFDTDERYVVFTEHDGLVRRGEKVSEGEVLETGELLINNIAKNNLLAAFDYEPAIVGAWNIGGDYLMFGKGGTFAQVKVSNDDPNCQVGMAYGSYSWNPATGAFSLELDSDTTAVEVGDSCSAQGVESATIEGNSMTMVEGEDTFELTKITPSESAPLAGAWMVGSGNLFTFTGDNTFVHAKIENDDPDCSIGWANGTFTWDAGTSLFTGTVVQDFTDEYEDSNCTLEGEVSAVLDGSSLMFSAEDDEFSMVRFGSPLN